MAIRARKLKESEVPGKTELYEIREPCKIMVEEIQADGSKDKVVLDYCVGNGSVGYFGKEYRPDKADGNFRWAAQAELV